MMASDCGSIPVCRISLSISDKMEWMPSSGSSEEDEAAAAAGGEDGPDFSPVRLRWQSTVSSSLSSVPLLLYALLLLLLLLVDLLLLLLLRLFLAHRAGLSGTFSSASRSSRIQTKNPRPPESAPIQQYSKKKKNGEI
jgi:hypothetical protein